MGEHLGQIETDPQVCGILRSRGVGYYYSDSSGYSDHSGDSGSAGAPGGGGRAPLWGEDWDVPSGVLERVDQGGSAAIWRIRWDRTPCG